MATIKILPLLAVRDLVLFPYMFQPLFVGREKSINAIQEAMKGDKEIIVAAQKDAYTNFLTPDDIYSVGTLGTILQRMSVPDGTEKILVEGKKRARIHRYLSEEAFYQVEAEELDDLDNEVMSANELDTLIKTVYKKMESFISLNRDFADKTGLLSHLYELSNSPSHLSDTIISHFTNLEVKQRQEILEITNPVQRLASVYECLLASIEILQFENKIHDRVKQQLEGTYEKYFQREKMKEMRSQLGIVKGSKSMALRYRVKEVATVTDDVLERTINENVAEGWRLEGIQFAMRDNSKRPSMAFVVFTREEAEEEENKDEG